MNFNVMFGRALRAAKLDVTLYKEVEADTSLNREALMVVIIAVLLSFFGSVVGAIFSSVLGGIFGAQIGFGTLLVAAVVAAIWTAIGYYIWSYLTWFIGTRFFGGTAEPGELMRTIGYAYAPQWLNVLNFIPCVGGLLSIVVSIWSLVAGIIAIREALDFDTGKAVITAIIGWLVIFVVGLIIAAIFGVGMMGLGALAN